jgi:pimeloyl-ACP methyl ester carboxylesterase
MANVRANGIQIEYDTFGQQAAKPLLLVMGLGAQMTAWDERFCGQLADAGHYVIRFDNRDVGLSQHFDDAGVPNMAELMQKFQAGEAAEAPYSLDDMADDAVGLLDALGIEAIHSCGASMGGMIVQAMAIRHPRRVRSMTSIMSTTGNPSLPQASPDAVAALMGPVPGTRDAAIESALKTSRVLGGGGFPFDEAAARERAAAMFDRSFHPQGTARQMAAIVTHGSRVEPLRLVKTPALVIHGSADPLVPVEGGKDTAACIPGAKLVLIEGLGHELPEGAWPQIIEPMTRLTRRVDG